jgi:DNA ligase-1
LRAFAFDIMYRDGQSLLGEPLWERMRALAETVQSEVAAGEAAREVLRAEIGETLTSAEQMQLRFEEALTRGLEGLVVKRVESPYQAGARNFNWVKLKKHSAGALDDTIDCVLLGYIFGRGKRADFGVGALLVGVYDQDADQFVTVSKIGTGLSDAQWREIRERTEPLRRDEKPARVSALITPSVWVEPTLVVEVLADEITRSPIHTAGRRDDEPGYALRFPRFLRFRSEDRRPEDATTVRELLQMYRLQRARETHRGEDERA